MNHYPHVTNPRRSARGAPQRHSSALVGASDEGCELAAAWRCLRVEGSFMCFFTTGFCCHKLGYGQTIYEQKLWLAIWNWNSSRNRWIQKEAENRIMSSMDRSCLLSCYSQVLLSFWNKPDWMMRFSRIYLSMGVLWPLEPWSPRNMVYTSDPHCELS